MIEITGSKKEQAVREWLNQNMDGVIPITTKVIDVFRKFELDHPEISYGCLNGTMKKVIAEGHSTTESVSVSRQETNVSQIELNVSAVEDMEFPDFELYRTGKKIDDLLSDHEEGGGVYGGTVNIVISESGVGKSTIILDTLASIMENNPDAKVLYISSEMTKNDIKFYYEKTPAIGKVPTLLLMEYVKSGTLNKAIQQSINGGWDIILIDSHQDILVKLKEAMGWKSTFAESWLTNLMIDAAETHGSAIFAIQHMTKGGQYVGSTYLKHATTAMMEIKFDDAGLRYVEFSKNRRGGSAVGKRLYFRLEEGNVVYDVNRFDETQMLKGIEEKEAIRQVDLSREFESIFIGGGIADDDEDVTTEYDSELAAEMQAKFEAGEIPLEIVNLESGN